MLAFASVEEMQAHYRAVKKRIEQGTPEFRARMQRAAEAAKAAEEPPPVLPQPEPVKEAPEPSNDLPEVHWDENGNKGHKKASKPRPIIEEEKPVEIPKIWLQELVVLVCDYTQIHRSMIWCPRRTHNFVKARFLVWALAREFCHQHSLPSIGKFCGRDHTTVLHGSIQGKKLPAYPELARQVRSILDKRAEEIKSQPVLEPVDP